MVRVLEVWLPLPLPPFDFLAPMHDGSERALGRRVAVAWQGGVLVGIVGAEREGRSSEGVDLRPAIAWVDGEEDMGDPVRLMLAAQARRSAVPIGVCLAQLFAAALKGPWLHQLRADPRAPAAFLELEGLALRDGAWSDAEHFASAQLDDWRAHALIEERVTRRIQLDRVWVAARPVDDALLGVAQTNQRRALQHAASADSWPSAAELARGAQVPASAVRSLISKGYLQQRELPPARPLTPWVEAAPQAPFLHAATSTPTATDDDARWLVTGGRAQGRFTRALDWLAASVDEGKQALLIVPEALGAETMAAATAARLPTLLWSADLDDDVREVVTAELRRGTPALLVGTPAALVVGLPKLARIALWDAASSANKQRSGARSVAWRDALELSEAAGAELMLLDPLASAELRGAPIRHHQRLPMERPRSALIDLRGESGWPLSTSLVRLLRQVVERDRQAVVISSRRGYASGLACRSCGAVEMCPNCDVALRYYARSGRLRCHRCGHATPKPTACSSCSHQTLEPRAGAGTEWVAEAVAGITRGLNPEARVWVYDRDQRDDLSALHAGATGVLVGTVALLRLPPLPNVSLIALTHGDSLHDHEDVRAEEGALRTLLLLPELATRERRPLLVAQVHHPDHPVWKAWTAADVDAALQHFEARVTERRAAFGYPPARVWARVQLSHRDERKVAEAARVLAAQLTLLGADLIGPAPAAIARSRGLYAYHLFLRAGTDAELAAALAAVPPRMSGGVVVRSDVDPYDLETMLS